MKESILRKGSQATGFKLLFLALTLLSFNGLTANRSVLTWIAYAVTAIGIAVLVIRVVCFKKYLHAKGLFLLIAFCGSYALSALLTRQYGLSENAKALVWMAFQYFILYTYDTTTDGTAEKKEFYIISHFFMAYTFLAVAAGTVMLRAGGRCCLRGGIRPREEEHCVRYPLSKRATPVRRMSSGPNPGRRTNVRSKWAR